ncbi:MAG: hypothetical protein FJW39_00850 [Acidobacteria bacterium]|nr:hypothetical protein [Acidobacteriota bacterium]
MLRRTTWFRIERAQGRTSWYVNKDMGPMPPGRWQSWHDFWKIREMSFVNVIEAGVCAAAGSKHVNNVITPAKATRNG